MTNAEKFRKIFKEFATEVWAFSEKDFLTWLNADYEESTIRNCFGCKYSKDNHNSGTEECHLCMWENQYTPTTKNNLGVDCISRQALLNTTVKKNSIWNKITDSEGNNLETIISNLPSVTPQEPRKGHWVHGEYCSECGCDVPAYIIDWKWQKDIDAKFCPNCRADMREVKE